MIAILLAAACCVVLAIAIFGRFVSKKRTVGSVVIARYEENLDWVERDLMPMLDSDARIVVYNKGRRETLPSFSSSNVEIVDLPNVGREGHTYLHHILETHGNKNRRPVLFVPGSCRAFPEKWEKVKKIIKKFDGASSTFVCDGVMPDDIYDFSIDRWAARESKNNATNSVDRLVPSPIRPFGKWFEEVVRNKDPPPRCLSLGGMFIAAARDLDRKPKAYYERIKSFLDGDDNVEAGHYVERAWPAIVLT